MTGDSWLRPHLPLPLTSASFGPLLSGEHPRAVRSCFTIRRDVPVESLPGDPELLAELADLRVWLAHRGHREPHLRGRHRKRPAPGPSSSARRGEAGDRPLRDQLAVKLGEGGENPENELACRGGGVDRRTLTGENLQADTAGSEVVDCVDQVVQIPAKPIQLPDHERVTGAKRFQARGQAGAVIAPTGRPVLVEAFVVDASLEEGVSLRVGGLGPVCFRDTCRSRRASSLPPVTYTAEYVTTRRRSREIPQIVT
jgi:hypothetical protein